MKFTNLLLSPRGVYKNDVDEIELCICTRDKRSILNQKDKVSICPPKFSIVNGLFSGWIPEEEYKKFREIEFHLMAPYHRVGALRKVSAGPGYCLSGHHHAFFLDNQVVCNELPRKPDDSLYRIILTGCWTCDEVKKMLKPQLVNPTHLKSILDIYHHFENKYFSGISYSDKNSSMYDPNEVNQSFIMDNGYYVNDKKYENINENDNEDGSDNEDADVGGDNLVHGNDYNKDSIVWFSTAKNTSSEKKQQSMNWLLFSSIL